MSTIDPEILYLILSKVARREVVYQFDPTSSPVPGTISKKQLAEVYERISGSRPGSRLNWQAPISQLSALLKRCQLPELGVVVLKDADSKPEAASLAKAHAASWPTFAELKKRYR
jgi:hypothetical protein